MKQKNKQAPSSLLHAGLQLRKAMKLLSSLVPEALAPWGSLCKVPTVRWDRGTPCGWGSESDPCLGICLSLIPQSFWPHICPRNRITDSLKKTEQNKIHHPNSSQILFSFKDGYCAWRILPGLDTSWTQFWQGSFDGWYCPMCSHVSIY